MIRAALLLTIAVAVCAATRAQAEVAPKLLLVGDSIVDGAVTSGRSTLVAQLTRRMPGLRVTSIARGGWRVSDPPLACVRSQIAPGDTVVIVLGTNDWAAGTPIDQFSRSYALMVDALRFAAPVGGSGLGATRVVCVTPIYREGGEAPNAVGARLGVYSDAIDAVCVARGLAVVDGMGLIAASDAAVLSDGVHPDGRGMRLMAARMARALDEVLP